MTFDINNQVETLINAAVLCDMFNAPELREFVQIGNGYVRSSGAAPGTVVIPGRGGVVLSPHSEPGTVVQDPATTTVHGMPLPELFAKWENRIYPLFHPYKTMPLPEAFTAQINGLDPALQKLALDPTDFPKLEAGEFAFQVRGNNQFADVASSAQDFTLMQGHTARGFRNYFLNRFPMVTRRQYAVLRMVKASIAGEQVLWQRLQKDVPVLIQDATDAFSRRQSLTIPLAVVNTLLDLAGLYPPAAKFTGPVKTVIGLLSKIPTAKKREPTFHLKGDDAESLWTSLQQAVKNLNAAAGEQEEALAGHLKEIRGLIAGERADFDLSAIDDPHDADKTSEADELATETDASQIVTDKATINLEFYVMHEAGRALKDVAPEFREAAGIIDGALSSGEWSRSGEIGRDYTGHYDETRGLADDLVSILLDTAQALERGGEAIQIAARRIQGEDDEANAALRRHKTEVERVEAREKGAG